MRRKSKIEEIVGFPLTQPTPFHFSHPHPGGPMRNVRRMTGITALILALACSDGGITAPTAQPPVQPPVNPPDTAAATPSIVTAYVMPSDFDGVSRASEVPSWLKIGDNLLATLKGRAFRTAPGVLVLRSAYTTAEIEADFGKIIAELKAASPASRFDAFLEAGNGSQSCGKALRGTTQVAVTLLLDRVGCRPIAETALHERIHLCGATSPSAPAYKEGEHVDIPGDIMNTGSTSATAVDEAGTNYWGEAAPSWANCAKDKYVLIAGAPAGTPAAAPSLSPNVTDEAIRRPEADVIYIP